ncbi:gamma-glutamyl-gamma-aminobutyrate hydrolase, partial [Burkholderia sp. Ac-20353]|nr:gamma-glutamyl-gamma-aminobutyrate hydrolase [Burkholderia sp. Ac-20353]
MSENTPSVAGSAGTSSSSFDSTRPNSAHPVSGGTPASPPAQASAARGVADDVAGAGASPVTGASEPGAPGTA